MGSFSSFQRVWSIPPILAASGPDLAAVVTAEDTASRLSSLATRMG